MKKKDKPTPPARSPKDKTSPEGYPLYPDKDDIYKKLHEDKSIDPEDKSKIKNFDLDDEKEDVEELNFDDEGSGDDLDIPGSELDDDLEDSGNEDEENNYYSIGGDRHEDLEEDQGDD